MKSQKGFTLIELLIVVAIIGIIAAIAIPSLLRARVSANESSTLGDIRSIISANATYQASSRSHQGYAQALTCLSTPSNAACIPNYAVTAPTFADAIIGSTGGKSGYNRNYFAGNAVPNGNNEVDSYCYMASPTTQNRTGVRSFGGDNSGVLAETTPPGAGVDCCAGGAALNLNNCAPLR